MKWLSTLLQKCKRALGSEPVLPAKKPAKTIVFENQDLKQLYMNYRDTKENYDQIYRRPTVAEEARRKAIAQANQDKEELDTTTPQASLPAPRRHRL